MLQIMRANPSHARDAAVLHVDAWRATYGGFMPAEYLDSLSYDSFTATWARAIETNDPLRPRWVAILDGELVGFVTGYPPEIAVPGYPNELGAIYTKPGMQRAGLGSALFAAYRTWLKEQGEKTFHLWAGRQNTRARAFYEAKGGKIVAERSDREFGGMQVVEWAFGFEA